MGTWRTSDHVLHILRCVNFVNLGLSKTSDELLKTLKDSPFKTILIIGKTGSGKSALCNKITGHNYDFDIFPVSDGATSCTQSTNMARAFFNGVKEKPPVNVIDTVGFDNPKSDSVTDTDVRIIAELVAELKNNCEYVNLFGIAVNGQAPRLDGSLVAMIKIFEEMFGEGFWKQCVLLFTRIPMSKSEKQRRAKANSDDEKRAAAYVREVEKKFPNSAGGLRYLFLDACYNEEDPEEFAHFQESMEELYKMLDSAPKLATSRVNENVQTETAKLRKEMDEEKKRVIQEVQEKADLEKAELQQEAERQRTLKEKADSEKAAIQQELNIKNEVERREKEKEAKQGEWMEKLLAGVAGVAGVAVAVGVGVVAVVPLLFSPL